MEELDSSRPKKKFSTLLMEILILLCVVVVAGAMGWFVGHGDVKNVRAVTRQFEEERMVRKSFVQSVQNCVKKSES